MRRAYWEGYEELDAYPISRYLAYATLLYTIPLPFVLPKRAPHPPRPFEFINEHDVLVAAD